MKAGVWSKVVSGVLVWWLVCLGVVHGSVPSQFRPGWIETDFPAGEKIAYRADRFPSNEDCIVAHLQDGSLALIDPASGGFKAKILPPGGVVGDGAFLHLEAGRLFVVESNYHSIDQKLVKLDVYNLGSGQWQSSDSGLISSGSFGIVRAVGLHANEIRVVLSNGTILRWNEGDVSPLPALALKPGSAAIRLGIGATFGTEFCLGIAEDDGGLILEKNGVIRKLAFPLGFSSLSGTSKASARYIVVLGEKTAEGTGFLVWNKQNPTSPPVYVKHPNAWDLTRFTFWNERLLLVAMTEVGLPENRLLNVIDLANPKQASIVVPLPPGTSSGLAYGISGGDFWSIQRNSDNLVPASDQIHRLPVFASGTLIAANVSDARANEADGVIRFKVSVDRSITQPVTVHLRTLSGSAIEGVDYVKWQGKVTLTPTKSTAEVVVGILDDRELESYESMIMEVTRVEGAWRARPYATGVIVGSGFRRIGELSAPPGTSGTPGFAPNWAMTPAGVLALGFVNSNEYGYFLKRPSGRNWERVLSLGTIGAFSYDSNSSIIDVLGDRVCVAASRSDPNLNAINLIAADVSTDTLLSTIPSYSRNALLCQDGLVAIHAAANKLGFHPFDGAGAAWQLGGPGAWGVNLRRYLDGQFVWKESDNDYSVRKQLDGGRVGTFAPFLPTAAKGGFWFGQTRDRPSNDFFVVGNASPSGHRFVTADGASPGEIQGELSDNGFLFFDSGSSYPDFRTGVLDCTTGANLTTIDKAWGYRPRSWANGVLGAVVNGDRLALIGTSPVLPRPLSMSVVIVENEAPQRWSLELSEAVDFPLTVRVKTSGPDLEAGAAVVVAPGVRNIPFPAFVVADDIPEMTESVPLTLEITGKEHVESHSMVVTIPANDFQILPDPPEGNIVEGASIALHEEGLLLGSAWKEAFADPRYRKIYTEPDSPGDFGHTVACNARYAVVGAPSLIGSRGFPDSELESAVFIYDRKRKSLIQTIKEPTPRTAFGSVIELGEKRLFVGAPGLAKTGHVKGYEIGRSGEVLFKQPKPAGTKDGFGTSIVSRGSDVWIGAPRRGTGRVYQFNAKTGRLVGVTRIADGLVENFGQSLEIIGSRLFVGAPSQRWDGSVFVFDLKTGKQVGRIPGPFPDGGNFGASLAVLDKEVLVVGCPDSEFAPEGGALLYGMNGDDPRFLTMLRPPKPKKKGDPQKLAGFGVAGGLSGAGHILGVAAGGSRSSLDVTAERSISRGTRTHYYVGFFDVSRYLPQATGLASREADGRTSDVWEKAMGPGVRAEDLPLTLRRRGDHVALTMPAIATLDAIAILVLERSSNLMDWVPVAKFQPNEVDAWIPLIEGGIYDAESMELLFPAGGSRDFFRIKCQMP